MYRLVYRKELTGITTTRLFSYSINTWDQTLQTKGQIFPIKIEEYEFICCLDTIRKRERAEEDRFFAQIDQIPDTREEPYNIDYIPYRIFLIASQVLDTTERRTIRIYLLDGPDHRLEILCEWSRLGYASYVGQVMYSMSSKVAYVQQSYKQVMLSRGTYLLRFLRQIRQEGRERR